MRLVRREIVCEKKNNRKDDTTRHKHKRFIRPFTERDKYRVVTVKVINSN